MSDANDEVQKHYWLYVLLLRENKYYIGITSHSDPHTRIRQHVSGSFMSAKWVERYPFVKTIELVDLGVMRKSEAKSIEDDFTAKYMKAFGYNNVRGGTLTYRGEYRKLGNSYLTDRDFDSILAIAFLTMVIGLLTLLFLLAK